MNKTFLGVAIAVVALVAGVMLFNDNAAAPTTPTPTPAPAPTPAPSPTPEESPSPTPNPGMEVPKTWDVSMTDSGFAPANLTIKKGDTVKYANKGTKAIWPASAPHPSHTDYSAFDPKKGIAVGESWSFTFTQSGRWPYHDHLNPTRFGSVTVE